MAMSGTSKNASAPARPENAPPWAFPLYAGGLLVVYLGERVLSGLPKGAGFVTALGLLATLAATFVRFSPRSCTSPRRGIRGRVHHTRSGGAFPPR